MLRWSALEVLKMNTFVADWTLTPALVGQRQIMQHASKAKDVTTSRHFRCFWWIQADWTLTLFWAWYEDLHNLTPFHQCIWCNWERTIVVRQVRLHNKLTVGLQVLLLVEVVLLRVSPMLVVISVLGERTSSRNFRLLSAVVMEVEQMIQVLLLASIIEHRIQFIRFIQSGGFARSSSLLVHSASVAVLSALRTLVIVKIIVSVLRLLLLLLLLGDVDIVWLKRLPSTLLSRELLTWNILNEKNMLMTSSCLLLLLFTNLDSSICNQNFPAHCGQAESFSSPWRMINLNVTNELNDSASPAETSSRFSIISWNRFILESHVWFLTTKENFFSVENFRIVWLGKLWKRTKIWELCGWGWREPFLSL